jgi:hypothetical protein
MKQEYVDEDNNLRDTIKELQDKIINNLDLNIMEHKFDIEEMNKLIELDHEHNKRSLNLVIFGLKEQKDEDTLAIVKEELKKK